MQQRPDEIEFLKQVLGQLEGLPEGFALKLLQLVAAMPEERAEAIRKLIEEHSA
jgi:hypothetical protein